MSAAVTPGSSQTARWARWSIAALFGLLSAGVAVGVGELVAAFVRPAASPIIVVGNRIILLTPEPVKRWAIREFGTNDKSTLLTGIYFGIALLAMGLGLLALRRRVYGVVGFGVFGVLGVYAALTTNAHHAADAIPAVFAAAAGMVTIWYLFSTLNPAPVAAEAGLIADRRLFLRGTLAAAAVTLFGSLGGRALQRSRYNAAAARAAITLPSPASEAGTPAAPVAASDLGVTANAATYDLGKSGVPFLIPSKDFYRIDTALTVPQIDPAKWRLRIHGMVEREITLSYDQLLARPLIERWITLTCVSNEVGGNLIGNTKFRGARLADLLREAGVHPEADQLVASSSDGMTIGSPTTVVMDGRDAMLAVGMNGEPLPTEHGFPVRMVVPGLYGYVSACKWIVDLEATTFASSQAYWVQGGWAPQGPILLASRIDTPSPNQVVSVGDTVAVAGVAWDQHVGVSAVEVQVDDGAWQQARLAGVPSVDTWRQWVYPWTVAGSGPHTLRVRATDATGKVQTSDRAEPYPSGATGLHAVTVRAR
ncbi:DMSO/TMAO reductase YedYZ molybdopterin-dependent catalytic subunit [Jatrophihabitans sp. GAS493]|uniref:molybdopterin-dependent oxidoreductase n=1 Tax=Jatrophihabitans sp. GAS493 TaxID=1907575 RepID=UPI000BB8DCFB|nr:molybdopterin-dependent oxidoreductase [Jatrophihabitans sp. GAS493]SOD71284.1 DMSO/TMAO reductase YedYZ molybdopterin-dependent catalytic subunit [Jatrophihabitans sp. GAS493]